MAEMTERQAPQKLSKWQLFLKLIMTPHMAGMSVERTYTAYELLKPSYDGFLSGSRKLVIKNPEVFDSPAFAQRGGKLFGIR